MSTSESREASGDEAGVGLQPRRFAPELVAAEMSYGDHVAGTAGYARLSGTGKGAMEFLVRAKSVSIGRAGFGADCELRSEARTVARRHAVILWDADADCWAIKCLSRSNAIMVDGAPVLFDTKPMPLKSRNLVELGDASFFFLAAVEPSFRTSDVDMLEQEIIALRDSRRVGTEKETGRTSAAKGRRRKKDEDISDDEYGDDELEQMSEARKLSDAQEAKSRAEAEARKAKEEKERALKRAAKRVAEETDDERMEDVGALRRDKKRRRSSSDLDDASEDDADRPLIVKKKDKKKDKKDKKKKKKKKKKKRRLEEPLKPRARGGETEDEGDESNDQMDALETRPVGDAMDEVDEPERVVPSPVSRLTDSASKRGSARKCREDWNKKERGDFCRAIFAVDVDKVYDGDGKLVCYDWTRFRGIAKLEKKSDDMLASFYARMMGDMEGLLQDEAEEKRTKGPRTKHKTGCDCVVCENTRKSRRKKEEENKEDDKPDAEGGDAGPDGGDGRPASPPKPERIIGLVTAQKLRVRMGIHEAARQVDSTAGQNVMQKLRSQPTSVAANGDLPDWWQTGVHDHALMVGAARHGVGQWHEIWSDAHNPEFVQTRVEEGDDLDWPTSQAAMKRLREVSNAINTEIRRMAKKKARRMTEDVTPAKSKRAQQKASSAASSQPFRRGRGGAGSRGGKKKAPAKGRGRAREEARRDEEEEESDDNMDPADMRCWEDKASDDVGEAGDANGEEEVEIEIEEDEEEEEEVEIEIEEEDEDAEDADDVVYNTASDSGQTD